MLDDQEEESWPKTYYKKTKKYMKRKLKSSKKDKGKKKKTKMYQDIMTQIESQTRYLFFFKKVRKYITIYYTLSTKNTLFIQ